MGKVISTCVNETDGITIVAGVDINKEVSFNYPVFSSIYEIDKTADVIIDFSHPALVADVIDYAVKKRIALVEATTGLDDVLVEKLSSASEFTPVFRSANMSVGINLIAEVCKNVAKILGDKFDIEIIEAHHNKKIDAPSGTALLLADEINKGCDNQYNYVYDRQSFRKARDKKEIGIHAIRGGTIVGEHEVIFAGQDEIVKISHSASSKEVFAVGSVKAAMYLAGKPAGLYDMSDVIKG